MQTINETDTCIIRMSDLLPFEWDTMYVKYRYFDLKTNDYCPTLTITFVKDFHTIYERFYNAKVTGSFDFEPHPLEFNKNKMKYTPDDAIFFIEKHKYGDKQFFFYLTPIDSLDIIRREWDSKEK
jgi:hypothetical protein